MSLLRVTQIEPRKGLMREVLDCLVPTLVDKLGTRGDDGKVIWVRCGAGSISCKFVVDSFLKKRHSHLGQVLHASCKSSNLLH